MSKQKFSINHNMWFEYGSEKLNQVLDSALETGFNLTPKKASEALLTLCGREDFTEELVAESDMFICRLIEHGADINYQSKSKSFGGPTPLINAVFMGNEFLVELLLKAGADPNGKNIEGFTPLMYACGKCLPGFAFSVLPGALNVISLLIKHGADPKIKAGKAQDALYWAKRNNFIEAIQIIGDSQEKKIKVAVPLRVKEAKTQKDAIVLDELAKDSSKVVRRAVALNRYASLDTLYTLIGDSDEEASLIALHHYLIVQGDHVSLESIVSDEQVKKWFEVIYSFFDGDFDNYISDSYWRKTELIARYSKNRELHNTIVNEMRKVTENTCTRITWAKECFKDLSRNHYIEPDVQRAYIFEFEFSIETVMNNVKDRSIFEEYFKVSDRPVCEREKVLEIFNSRFDKIT